MHTVGNHSTSLLGHRKPLGLTLAQGKATVIELRVLPFLLRPAKNLWEEGAKVPSHPAGKASLAENLISTEDCRARPRSPGSSRSFPACPLQGGGACADWGHPQAKL